MQQFFKSSQSHLFLLSPLLPSKHATWRPDSLFLVLFSSQLKPSISFRLTHGHGHLTTFLSLKSYKRRTSKFLTAETSLPRSRPMMHNNDQHRRHVAFSSPRLSVDFLGDLIVGLLTFHCQSARLELFYTPMPRSPTNLHIFW